VDASVLPPRVLDPPAHTLEGQAKACNFRPMAGVGPLLPGELASSRSGPRVGARPDERADAKASVPQLHALCAPAHPPERPYSQPSAPLLKSPDALVDGTIATGAAKAAMSAPRTFVLAVLSGTHIAFGSCLALIIGGNCHELRETNPGLQQFVFGAIGLPLGLLMTTITGAELFTGNACVVTTALLARQASWAQWCKSLTVSYAGNLLGSLIVAALFVNSGTLHGGARDIALAKVSHGWGEAFCRGLLANWLVCMAVWMASGCADLTSKAVAIWFPVSAFVAMGLEHSVANMTIIPVGMMLGAPVSGSQFVFANLVPVTLGNLAGGALAVAGGYMLAYRFVP
jgi:formate/nitrite transporter